MAAGGGTRCSMCAALAVGLLLPGCSFDRGGLPAGIGAGDGAAREAGRPDLVPDRFVAVDRWLPDLWHPDHRVDTGPPPQGTTCKTAAGSIAADTPPVACSKVTLTVVAKIEEWVMAGIAAGPNPTKASYTWQGGAQTLGCSAMCSWKFVDVEVPCAPGPYTFGFMASAFDDEPDKGTIRISCVP